MIINIIGTIACISEKKNTIIQENYIERNDYGLGSKKVDLYIRDENNQTQKLNFELDEMNITENKAEEIFLSCYPKVIKKMLGKNKNTEDIFSDLCFIPSIDNVDVFWNIDNNNFINSDGKLFLSSIISYFINNESADNIIENIKLTLQIGEYQKEYTLPICINRTIIKNSDYSEFVKLAINENNESDEKRIELPKTINGVNVSYYKKNKSMNKYIFILGACSLVVLFVLYDRKLKQEEVVRRNQLELDYAGIVNKITLLESSGLTILAAWDKMISDYRIMKEKTSETHYAYEEMILARTKISAGLSENEAYLSFGQRCELHSYVKFSNMLDQNLKKGTRGLRNILMNEVVEAFENKKSVAKKKGEEATTKLLFPMILLLIMSIALIMVPAFMSISI